MTRARLSAVCVGLSTSGCAGVQSIAPSAGAHTSAFNSLFVVFLVVCGFFYLLVIGFLGAAILRRRRQGEDGVPALFRVWVGLVSLSLVGLALASWLTDRAMASYGDKGPPVRIRLTANQWWWDVEYLGANPSEAVRTANEVHLPIGRPTLIELQSNDVIHSFWVPNLAGKQDLIPGRTEDIALLPRKIGVFRGQCAEFCGAQHAHMALTVVVEPEAQFRSWWRQQQAEAPAPRTPEQLAGMTYVTTRECATCHAIAGTTASASVAPDLTHIASRKTIAAGTLPMSRGGLYAWIADPQGVKPGAHMPYIGLEARQLDAVVAYLETLK
ncbi:putative cytochrome c oxidase subunit II [Sphingomonas changbaiensis NBRC 104936]|uniref:Putative cytochrome c oxidase subunit II n=1 Tax=Sphingomonas changbaiensis NBRC 104936 TaxID=1219043 RepID=A0A0E9MM19_9SPHN|nr:c-type cytochrome [Sphingomonas changbaiensis]GAO38847.1 putative cytochrome c oxidase subunit II [Sphingomonas changbaiensis NBRC 104936]